MPSICIFRLGRWTGLACLCTSSKHRGSTVLFLHTLSRLSHPPVCTQRGSSGRLQRPLSSSNRSAPAASVSANRSRSVSRAFVETALAVSRICPLTAKNKLQGFHVFPEGFLHTNTDGDLAQFHLPSRRTLVLDIKQGHPHSRRGCRVSHLLELELP